MSDVVICNTQKQATFPPPPKTKLLYPEQIFTLQIKEYKALVKSILKTQPQYTESTVTTK